MLAPWVTGLVLAWAYSALMIISVMAILRAPSQVGCSQENIIDSVTEAKPPFIATNYKGRLLLLNTWLVTHKSVERYVAPIYIAGKWDLVTPQNAGTLILNANHKPI